MLGKAVEFQAVPGCGLKCRVLGMDQMLRLPLSNSELEARRDSRSSFQVTIDGLVRSVSNVNIIGELEGMFICEEKDLLCMPLDFIIQENLSKSTNHGTDFKWSI